MGAADLVPGVSGGTIALVLGIYERLVASIRRGSSAIAATLRRDFRGAGDHLRSVEWLLLVPLFAGIGLAILTLASVIETQLHENPTVMAGAFFGLVVGSILIAWGLMRSPRPQHLVILVLVGAIVFVLLGLGEDATVSDPSLLVFFASGALAICAMILPGISGSLILLLVGMYPVVLGAVNDRDLAAVGVFALGCVVGLALFSQVLDWALTNHHDLVLSALIGLMAGSLRVVWPWPDGVDSSALEAPGSDVWQVTLAAVVGLVVVFVIARLAGTRQAEVSSQPTA